MVYYDCSIAISDYDYNTVIRYYGNTVLQRV